MFWLKSCPKCDTGDLYDGQDQYGRYIDCLQCGHYLTEVEEVVLRYVARTARIQPLQAPWVGWDISADTLSATSPRGVFNQHGADRGAPVTGKSLVEAVPGIPPGQSNPRAAVA